MSNEKTGLSLPIGKDREYFVPELVFDEADAERCAPVVYFPELIIAEEQPLPSSLREAAWKAYCNPPPAGENNGCGDVEIDEKSWKVGGKKNRVIYVRLDQDTGESAIFQTDKLKLAQYGCQTIRAYGPEKFCYWKKQNDVWFEEEEDLSTKEKLMCFNHLNQKADKLEENYKLTEKAPGHDDYQNRGGHFEFVSIGDEYKQGRFNQQQEEEKTADIATYATEFRFLGQTFKRHITLSSSTCSHQKFYRKTQILNNGRKSQVIREALAFNGETEKTIRYWYDDPVVTVLAWTDFIDVEGQLLKYRPNNAVTGKDFKKNKRDYAPKRGKTFIADKVCWGSLLVEYTTSYTEFIFFYDFPEPRRTYEVMAGHIDKVGYITLDVNRNVKDRGNYLEGNYIGHDKIVDDPDWVEENQGKSLAKPPPQVAIKLFKKIQFKPFPTPPLELFYTNGRQATYVQWTPPQPKFMDLPVEEIPKIALFEQRIQVKVPGGAKVEHVEEIKFLDIYGNITTEKLERRKEE